jgi:hypothetical protein
MAFISNVIFRPVCACGSPDTHHHSLYGYICANCHFDIRSSVWLNDHDE